MVVRTMPEMFNGMRQEQKNLKKIPQNMTDAEIKHKLCHGVAIAYRSCEVLDVCKFGAEAVKRWNVQ